MIIAVIAGFCSTVADDAAFSDKWSCTSFLCDFDTFCRQTLDEFSEIQKLSREVDFSWTIHPRPCISIKYLHLHCICICTCILYSSWVERWSSFAPVSKFFSFLLTQECKKAKSQKLAEILKSIESAAQEVFVDVVYYHDVDNDDDVDADHDVDNEDYGDHLERRSRGFVAFLRPSVHPIQDEVNFTQFRMTWMSTLRQRSRKCRRSEIPTWIFLPSRMRLLSQALWRKVRPKRDTNRKLVNTLFKVKTKATTSELWVGIFNSQSHITSLVRVWQG